MSRDATRIEALRERIGQEVLLEGWLYNRRSSGKLEFLLVRDGSGTVQCVAAKAELPEDVFARCASVTQESAIRVRGLVREDHRAPSGRKSDQNSIIRRTMSPPCSTTGFRA